MVCECGFSISVWEAGGVRWKAASKKKRVLGHCPTCGQMKMLRLERWRDGIPPSVSA